MRAAVSSLGEESFVASACGIVNRGQNKLEKEQMKGSMEGAFWKDFYQLFLK
jgi:hypothetical protein